MQDPIRVCPIGESRLSQVCSIHCQAFARSYSVRLGRAYVHSMIAWFASSPDRIAVAAVNSKNDAVGYVLGAPIGYSVQMTEDLGVTALMGIVRHPTLIFHREFRTKLMDRLLKVIRKRHISNIAEPILPQPAMSLVAIGVAPNIRQGGIGSRLLNAFEAECRERGMVAMRLSVRDENIAAISLYRKMGWGQCPEALEIPQAHYYKKTIAVTDP